MELPILESVVPSPFHLEVGGGTPLGQEKLEAIFGLRVDLVSKRGIEASRNNLRRQAIISKAEVIYAAYSRSQLLAAYAGLC